MSTDSKTGISMENVETPTATNTTTIYTTNLLVSTLCPFLSLTTTMPILTPKPILCHSKYWIRGGDLYLLVDNITFKVHHYFFKQESEYFTNIDLAIPALRRKGLRKRINEIDNPRPPTPLLSAVKKTGDCPDCR